METQILLKYILWRSLKISSSTNTTTVESTKNIF